MSKKEIERRDSQDPQKKATPAWKSLLIHLALMAVAGLLLLWGAMWYLKVYTRHGEAIKTPDIIGLTQEQAMELLNRNHLNMEVVDSIYVEGKTPGTILDTTPKAGSSIKPNRTLFVTVNTMNVKSIVLPEFAELSERSVEMMLRGAGFKYITSEYVPDQHHLLVLRLKDSTGHYLKAGDRVPYNTQLIMEVSSADLYESALIDSLHLGNEARDIAPAQGATEPEATGENWF